MKIKSILLSLLLILVSFEVRGESRIEFTDVFVNTDNGKVNNCGIAFFGVNDIASAHGINGSIYMMNGLFFSKLRVLKVDLEKNIKEWQPYKIKDFNLGFFHKNTSGLDSEIMDSDLNFSMKIFKSYADPTIAEIIHSEKYNIFYKLDDDMYNEYTITMHQNKKYLEFIDCISAQIMNLSEKLEKEIKEEEIKKEN